MKQIIQIFATSRAIVLALVINVSAVGLIWHYNHSPEAQSAVTVPVTRTLPRRVIQGTPARIIIPSLNIDVAIDVGTYNSVDASWTLSGYHAQYADLTVPANNSNGNTLIYGHNNKYVFGRLRADIPANTQVEIIATNGNHFYYTYVGSQSVTPDDVSLFSYTGSPMLVVQTCTGSWHEQRKLATFRFDKVIVAAASTTSYQQRHEALISGLTQLTPSDTTELLPK